LSTSTITSKDQITVPKAVRAVLKLKEGDQVVFVFEGERAYLYPIRKGGIERLRGALKNAPRFTTREAEREAAHREAARKALGHDVAIDR